jgi:hypothetical protein
MVRLLPMQRLSEFSRQFEFQSHNGAIAATAPAVEVSPDEMSFNPTMVRLLREMEEYNREMEELVSIPQWCDCCLLVLLSLLFCRCVSIPQWCDCCIHH